MTAAVLLLLTAGCGILLVLLFGALVELHRQIDQLRQMIGLVDDARPMPFNADVAVSDLSIPALHGLSGKDSRSALLILSDHCSTCFEIADNLPAALPEGLVVLVQSSSAADATRWLASHGLTHGSQVVYDEGGQDAGRLGVKGTPMLVRFEEGHPVSASSVPSILQVELVTEWLGGSVDAGSSLAAE